MRKLLFLLALLSLAPRVSAQVVSIGQIGPSTPITTTIPISGTAASTVADGANVVLGSKADAKSTATDTTAISIMQVLKQMSASLQAPPSQAVTNAGTFATQSATTVADGANVTLGAKADAKSTATDTTSISIMQVLKQISASVQAPPSQAVTNAGTFVTQSVVTQPTGTNLHMVCDSGCSSSAGFADNAAFTYGTTAVNPIAGVLDDVSTNVATENSAAIARITAQKALHVNLRTAAGVEITPSVDATTNTAAQTTGPQLFVVGSAATPSAVGADGRSVGLWSDLVGRLHILGTDGDVFVRQTTAANLNMRADTSGATGAAPPARANFIGGLGSGATGGFIVGVPVADTFKAVSVTSGTTTLMVTGVSGRHVRIGAVHLVTAIANNVVFISGTGATCGTGTAAMAGGTTAANGYNLAANGGLAMGSGFGTIMQTVATGDSVCIITSAAGPLAGTIAYTIY